jgi:hypothetical protein
MDSYVSGLPDASGTFTGTFDPGSPVIAAMLQDVPELLPIEIDTGNAPNPARVLTSLGIRSGDQEWVLPVDHTDLIPGSNRVRVWVRRPGPEGSDG